MNVLSTVVRSLAVSKRRLAWVAGAAVLAGGCPVQPVVVTQPPRPVVVEAPRARVGVSPSSVDFREVEAGRAAEAEVAVRNEGDADLRVARAVADGAGFRLVADGCSGRWLRPGDVCPLRVAFEPDRDGRYAGALDLSVPEIPERQLTVPLSGDAWSRRRPNIRVSAAAVDFGVVEGQQKKTASLEVRNDGRGDLRLEGIAVSGAAFDLTSDGCSGRILAPGRSCTVAVRFDPDRWGDYSGTLAIPSNDPDQRQVAVPLRGRAEKPARPDIAVEPARLDFGRVDAGRARELGFEVRNTGRGELRVKGAFVEGGGFEVVSDGCADRVVPPGRTCPITVRFSPPAGGAYGGTVTVVSNDPDERRAAVSLAGQGQPRGQPNLRTRPPRVDFGALEAGTAALQDVEIANEGRAELIVQELLLEGQGFFPASDTCRGRPVPPGRACVVSVRFEPDRPGEYAGSLVVGSNDPDQRRVAIPLKGAAEGRRRPEITLNPSRLDFGRTEAGTSRTRDVEVRNDGRAELRVKRARVEGAGFSIQSDGCSDRVVPPGRSCGVSVAFTPDAGGEFNGTLTVPSNDPDERRSFVALRGLAEQRGRPDLRVSPQRLEFGSLEVGSSRTQEVEVRNDGRADLRVQDVNLSGPAYGLAQDTCSGRPVAPGRVCVLSVRFSPNGPGDFPGNLTLGSNDPAQRAVTVPLHGQGERRGRPEPGRPPDRTPPPPPPPAPPKGPPPLPAPPPPKAPPPGERGCRTQRIDLQGDRGGSRALVEGDLGGDPCITLEFRAEEKGNLVVCAPEGYEPRGGGLEPSGNGCDLGSGRYREFRGPKLKKDQDVSLTLGRGPGSPSKFRIQVEVERKDEGKPRPPLPPFGPGRGRRGD